MDLNKITADLDFINSVIHRVEVKSDMVKISNDTKKSFGLDVKCSAPVVKDDLKFGKLLMQVDVLLFKDDESLDPDTFKIVIEGIFKTTAAIPDEKFMELLNVNGGAALFSIARSKIETLSSLTYSEGKIVLPMINMLQYFAERNRS